MTDEQKYQALKDLIVNQYELMGFAVLSIEDFLPGTFKLGIIDPQGPREVLVTVMLHMVPINATDKC